MWVCLGQTLLVGDRRNGPQTPGRMRSARNSQIMARPKATDARTRQLNLSLTERELESIKRRASALGMRPAHFGRALILSQNDAPTAKHDPDGNAQRLIYAQLVRLGNNLNQMVRHLHRTDDPLPADLEPLLRDIRHIIARRVDHDR
jgi:hypothetical protein